MIKPEEHLGLVRRVARGFSWACSTTLEMADLEQEGMQGVIRAAESFDPKRGRFSTYATPWILHYIQKAVHNGCRTVRVPMPVSRRAWKSGEPISLTTTSLDQRPDGADGSFSLADMLGYTTDAEGPQNVEADERRELVAHLLSTLTERQATVLRLRFFDDLTLFETGRRVGLTKERTRQVQNEALELIASRMKREAL